MTISNQLFNDMTFIVASHLYVSQSLQIKTDSIELDFVRNNMTSLNTTTIVQDAQIKVASYCGLMPNANCSDRILTQRVTIFDTLIRSLFYK